MDIQVVKVIVERGTDLGAVYVVQLVRRIVIDDVGHDDQTQIHTFAKMIGLRTRIECQAAAGRGYLSQLPALSIPVCMVYRSQSLL